MSVRNCFVVILFFVLPVITFQCFVILIKGKRFNEISFKIISKSTLFSCAADCLTCFLCKSVSFDTNELTCFLHSTNDSEKTGHLLSEKGFFYAALKDVDDVPLGPCRKHECELYQRCRVNRGYRHCVDMRNLLSLGKKTNASSSGYGSPPSNAVDGNRSPNWWHMSCFHVDRNKPRGWWQVDLGADAFITDVLIVHRGNECCAKRLRNFDLEAFTEDPSLDPAAEARICYRHPDDPLASGAAVTFNCTTPVVGRYFRVSIPHPDHDNFVQICEVEVYGWFVE